MNRLTPMKPFRQQNITRHDAAMKNPALRASIKGSANTPAFELRDKNGLNVSINPILNGPVTPAEIRLFTERIEHLPAGLVEGALLVIPANSVRNFPGELPFAHVIAAPANPVLSAKPLRCLHVYERNDGNFELREGIIGIEKKVRIIGSDQPWPEMHKALESTGRSPWLNPPKGQPAYIPLKLWQEENCLPQGFAKDPRHTFTPITALRILYAWNGWVASDTPWKNRMSDVFTDIPSLRDPFENLCNRLAKRCAEIGLKNGHPVNWTGPCFALLTCVALAKAICVDRMSRPPAWIDDLVKNGLLKLTYSTSRPNVCPPLTSNQ